MARRTIEQILDDLIERFQPEIRDAFRSAMQDIVDRAILSELARAIGLGDVEGAFRALGFTDAAMRPITAMIERAFETGGITVGEAFPRRLRTPQGSAVYRFDVRNSRAEAWLRDHSSQLVTRMQDEALGGVRNLLTEGMRDGRNPRNTALDIVGRVNPVTKRREGGIIGLSAPQERWAANMRRELLDIHKPRERVFEPLTNRWRYADDDIAARYFARKRRNKSFDRMVQRAINEGKPLSAENINKIVGKYKDNLLQLRGETIARTESIQALNKAADEAVRQVVDSGAIRRSAARRVWDSAGDDGRTRKSHLAMDGQEVGIDEPFKTPGGELLMFPGDTSLGASAEETINCRCRPRWNIDWLDDLD